MRAKVLDEPRFTAAPLPGTYYIRIAAADVNGVATSPYSNVALVKVQQKTRAPAAVQFGAPQPVFANFGSSSSI